MITAASMTSFRYEIEKVSNFVGAAPLPAALAYGRGLMNSMYNRQAHAAHRLPYGWGDLRVRSSGTAGGSMASRATPAPVGRPKPQAYVPQAQAPNPYAASGPVSPAQPYFPNMSLRPPAQATTGAPAQNMSLPGQSPVQPGAVKMRRGMGYDWLAKQWGGGVTGAQVRKHMKGRMLLAGKEYARPDEATLKSIAASKGMASKFKAKKQPQPHPAAQLAAPRNEVSSSGLPIGDGSPNMHWRNGR